jgi:hypothetical protein
MLTWTDGPFKPAFGLSGAVPRLDRVCLPLVRVLARPFRLDLYDAQKHKIPPLRRSSPAMICCGRDGRIEKI